MNVATVLERLSALGVQITPRPGGNLWLEPASKIPPPLLALVRQHKPEIMAAVLKKPGLVAGPPEWQAGEVERLVLKEGYCIFWSDLFNELVAFIADETFLAKVPGWIVAYTCEELHILFPDNGEPDDTMLRLIHAAKKVGAHVTGHEWREN